MADLMPGQWASPISIGSRYHLIIGTEQSANSNAFLYVVACGRRLELPYYLVCFENGRPEDYSCCRRCLARSEDQKRQSGSRVNRALIGEKL